MKKSNFLKVKKSTKNNQFILFLLKKSQRGSFAGALPVSLNLNRPEFFSITNNLLHFIGCHQSETGFDHQIHWLNRNSFCELFLSHNPSLYLCFLDPSEARVKILFRIWSQMRNVSWILYDLIIFHRLYHPFHDSIYFWFISFCFRTDNRSIFFEG